MDAMELRLEVVLLGFENVLDPGLRIAVDERKPTALDLDHQPVAGLERVVHVT